jgi:hypothetical protein
MCMGVDQGGDKGAGTMIEERVVPGSEGIFAAFTDFPYFTGLDQDIAVFNAGPRVTDNPPGTVNAVIVW